MKNLETLLLQGDTIGALELLNEMPPVPIPSRSLSIRKITLANSLSDSIYASVLKKEFNLNQALFVEYLYHLYSGDSVKLERVYDTLSSMTGETALVDSLRSGEFFWY